MNKAIRNIFIILIAAAAVISCDKALVADNGYELGGDYRIVVTGSVSAMDNTPLEEIKVTLNAYPPDVLYPLPLVTKTVYTDNKGLYSVDAFGFSGSIICNVKAESQDGSYNSETQELKITWSGPSFDEKNNTFFVNDCNFKLVKP